MNQLGLRFYILFNILVICGVGMILIGIISIKITERSAIQAKIDSTTAVINVFETTYFKKSDINQGVKFLQNALSKGSWGFIKIGKENIYFETPKSVVEKKYIPTGLVNRVSYTKTPEIYVEGLSFLPFKNYESYKIAAPLINGGLKGTIFIYEPLKDFNKNIQRNQRFLALWVFLFMLLIAIFGYYLLSKTVVNPVHKLISLTKDISRGITPLSPNTGNITEINKLQDALVSMANEIEASKKKLEVNIDNLEDANKKIIETQKELIATEKMASLGKLSAGVAHEIGNPLSAISGYMEILRKSPHITEQEKNIYLEKITGEIERINKIISTLLDYAIPRETTEARTDLNETIQKAVELLTNQGIFKRISLYTDLSRDPLTITIDEFQLLQVFINLLINARDAVDVDGEIRIKSFLNDRNLAEVSIKDNGMGIDMENLDKIFDPFFTTKEPGSGTGLGLSISHRIIKQFDGNITVNSNPGEDTEFILTFPILEKIHAESIVN